MKEVNERKENKKMIYLVIGLLTLILSTAGATYAYFTATDNDTDTITGNMATITFELAVTKMTTVDEEKPDSTNERGLIPLSNSMVEYAVANRSVGNNGICKDDNGNAVCQIYKITVTNTGTAGMLLDGYVTLTGGTGSPTDLPNYTYADTDTANKAKPYDVNYYTTNNGNTVVDTSKVKNATTMRWSQVFCDETSGVVSNCTTAGRTTTNATKSTNGVDKGITTGDANKWGTILNTGTTTDTETINTVTVNHGESAKNRKQMLTSNITTKAMIAGSEYDVINTNFIRISNHDGSATSYTRTADVTSALMFNEFLSPQDATTNPIGGSSATYTDSQVYYIVVWLSETGTNQTLTTPESRVGFFSGVVKFISAQGSEVTATFTDYTRVPSDNL